MLDAPDWVRFIYLSIHLRLTVSRRIFFVDFQEVQVQKEYPCFHDVVELVLIFWFSLSRLEIDLINKEFEIARTRRRRIDNIIQSDIFQMEANPTDQKNNNNPHPQQTKPPNPIKHFHLNYELPKWATIQPFTKTHQKGANKPKNKHKLNKFTYYRVNGNLVKYLYLNENTVVDQGEYPFTNPSGQIKNVKEIEGELNRVVYIEMVYIGHFEEEGKVNLVLKKMTEAKFDTNTSELETINDNFQVLEAGNSQRFQQFLKVQLANPNAQGMSIRVIVDQKFGQEKDVEVIDYEFFKREETLKANKVYQDAINK